MSISNQETFGKGFQVIKNTNHWDRNALSDPTPPKDYSMVRKDYALIQNHNAHLKLYPNPAQNEITVEFETEKSKMYTVSIYQYTGSATNFSQNIFSYHNFSKVQFQIKDLPSGIYLVTVREGTSNIASSFFIKP